MALGWVMALALLGLWSGTVSEPLGQPAPDKVGRMVLQSEQLQRGIEQTRILGQSV